MLRRDYFNIEKKTSFKEEIISCIQILKKKYFSDTIIGIIFFMDISEDVVFVEKKNLIRALFNKHFGNMPVNVLAQSPHGNLVVELWLHDRCEDLAYKELNGMTYTVYVDFPRESTYTV